MGRASGVTGRAGAGGIPEFGGVEVCVGGVGPIEVNGLGALGLGIPGAPSGVALASGFDNDGVGNVFGLGSGEPDDEPGIDGLAVAGADGLEAT